MCMYIVALGVCVEGVPQPHLELVRVTPISAQDDSVCYEHSPSTVARRALISVRPSLFVEPIFVISEYFYMQFM